MAVRGDGRADRQPPPAPDHFAQGQALLLTHQWGDHLVVGGQSTCVEDAADLVAKAGADLAIIDLSIPPETRILAFSGTDDLRLAEEALRAGGDGFLRKTPRPDALAAPLSTMFGLPVRAWLRAVSCVTVP